MSALDIPPSRHGDSALASKRRMGLIAGGIVLLVGLGAALVFSRSKEGPEESGSKNARAALEPASPDEAGGGSSVFLPLGGRMPSGSSRDGFVTVNIDGRHVAQMSGRSKVAFRLAPLSTRYGVSSIVRLSGVKSASLTPNLGGQALSPWQLREGWSPYSSVVEGDALAQATTYELVFAASDLPAGVAIEVESISIAPILDRASFDTGPESEGHWVDGFHKRERGAIWSRGVKSTIGVVLEPRRAPYELNVRGRTLAGLGSLLVKARVNEREVGSAEVTSQVDDVTWTIPSDLLENGANRIDLEYPKTGQPASFNPSSSDTRELAFRISSVELAPAD